MRISDWSSDVCSSDLRVRGGRRRAGKNERNHPGDEPDIGRHISACADGAEHGGGAEGRSGCAGRCGVGGLCRTGRGCGHGRKRPCGRIRAAPTYEAGSTQSHRKFTEIWGTGACRTGAGRTGTAHRGPGRGPGHAGGPHGRNDGALRSEEHTSELQSLMRISYAVFCLKKTKYKKKNRHHTSIEINN